MTTREIISFRASPPPTAAPQVVTAHRNSSSKLDGPVLRSDLSPTINAIVEELQRTFFGILPATAIAQCATRAVQDLLGSICLQALPEMAIRLATVRLQTGRADTEQPDTEQMVTGQMVTGQMVNGRLETVPPAVTVPPADR